MNEDIVMSVIVVIIASTNVALEPPVALEPRPEAAAAVNVDLDLMEENDSDIEWDSDDMLPLNQLLMAQGMTVSENYSDDAEEYDSDEHLTVAEILRRRGCGTSA